MSEPAQQGIQLSHGLAAGLGAAIVAIGRVLWGAVQKSRDGEIAALREQLAVERAARERAESSLAKVGSEKDALRDQLESERIKAAGVAYRIRQDPNVDDSFAEEMPTAVRERAALLAPMSDPHSRWGADPNPAKPWDVTASTPPGARPALPKPRPR